MENTVFFIEVPKPLSDSDFKNLRKLYLPIIGINSIMIYEYLCDLYKENKEKLLSIESLCNHLQINFVLFKDGIEKLEAVGLVKTYKKRKHSSFIYKINKPSDIESFDKNPLLKSHLLKSVGQSEYDKIYFEQKQSFINKSDYHDVSKKYQDVFTNVFEENLDVNDSYVTMDLVFEKFKTHDESVANLPSTHFIKYLMNRNASYYEIQLVNTMLKMGFKDSSINLLIDFSVKYNNFINCPYIIKISQDFRNRSIINFNDVKHEISIIEEYKQRKRRKGKSLGDQIFETSFSDTDEGTTTSKEISIEDIFSDEDVEGIF